MTDCMHEYGEWRFVPLEGGWCWFCASCGANVTRDSLAGERR